jgi:transposase
MVSPDETSWKVAGALWWLWVFATPSTVVYAIQHGRGFDEAATVLGANFAGVLVRDGWAPYRRFVQAAHQTCLAHVIRRCREIAEAHPRAVWPRRVQAVLQDALAVRDRLRAGVISAHGAAVARGYRFTRLSDLLTTPGPLAESQRLAAHLWDDGLIDPIHTRDALGLCLALAARQDAPGRGPALVYRM